eukprot:879405-Prorocentrum_minimum.AAC.2
MLEEPLCCSLRHDFHPPFGVERGPCRLSTSLSTGPLCSCGGYFICERILWWGFRCPVGTPDRFLPIKSKFRVTTPERCRKTLWGSRCGLDVD